MPNNQFLRNASGQLIFEMFRVPADCYAHIRDDVVKVSDLIPHTPVVSNGFDIIFQDFQRGDAIVGLEWDNWSGFIVVAKNREAEDLVREIANYLLASRWATVHLSQPDGL